MAAGSLDNNEEEITGINVTPLVDIMLGFAHHLHGDSDTDHQ